MNNFEKKMKNTHISTKYLNGLQAINYNINEAISEFLLLNLSAKIAEYKQECMFYKKKYNADFTTFEKKINNRKNEENFEEYDDYMAWKFAEESKRYFQKNLNEIQITDK